MESIKAASTVIIAVCLQLVHMLSGVGGWWGVHILRMEFNSQHRSSGFICPENTCLIITQLVQAVPLVAVYSIIHNN